MTTTLAGIRVLGHISPAFAPILTPDALAFLAELHRSFVAAGIGPEDTVALMKQFTGYRNDAAA